MPPPKPLQSLNNTPTHHAKTKSPKPPKASFSPTPKSQKSEEKWIDGPNFNSDLNKASPKKKAETWIDGPAARVSNAASNFPSPKRCIAKGSNSTSKDPSIMTATKAEMIQKWISNQTNFDDMAALDDSFFGGAPNSNSSWQQIYEARSSIQNFYPEPEYKALTVFKTAEDEELNEEEKFEFEIIEVVEPEEPVATCDVCLQVTEEDILLAFMEEGAENPLPESDQNFTIPLFASAQGMELRLRSASFSEYPTDNGINCCSSFRPSPSPSAESQHPLRILSQECLTIVSTFNDTLSTNGDHKICHGLCKNLATLSQMSLDNLNYDAFDLDVQHLPLPKSPQKSNPPAPIIPVVQEPPILSEIFKLPPPTPKRRISLTNSKPAAKDSDAESELPIPPMELLDINQIKNNCNPTIKPRNSNVNQNPFVQLICDHPHSNSVSSPSPPLTNINSSSNPNPPVSPVVIDIAVSPKSSPSKSKSRKIAKFFRSRSKSPKKVLASAGATSSGESSSPKNSSSSASSCSSGASGSSSKGKLQIPLKILNPNSVGEFHKSALPIFLPVNGKEDKIKSK